jgi:hypothetical protein
MSGFGPFDAIGVVAVGFVLVKVLGPMARAFAKRLEGRPPAPSVSDAEVTQLREELDQLHERVDFLERALATRQASPELPRGRTPA